MASTSLSLSLSLSFSLRKFELERGENSLVEEDLWFHLLEGIDRIADDFLPALPLPLKTQMTCTFQKSLFVLHFLEDLVTLPPRSPTVIVPAVSPSLRASTFLNVSSVCFISSRPDSQDFAAAHVV